MWCDVMCCVASHKINVEMKENKIHKCEYVYFFYAFINVTHILVFRLSMLDIVINVSSCDLLFRFRVIAFRVVKHENFLTEPYESANSTHSHAPFRWERESKLKIFKYYFISKKIGKTPTVTSAWHLLYFIVAFSKFENCTYRPYLKYTTLHVFNMSLPH